MRIPLTRYGAKELTLFGGGALVLTVGLVVVGLPEYAVLPALLLLFVLAFFRDPERRIPDEPGALVAPADGKVVAIAEVDREEFIDGPARRIDIFLAVYDVHVNRSPVAGEVKYVESRDGAYLNALHMEAGEQNRARSVGIAADDGYPVLVRQIVGAIARRLVCGAGVGDRLSRGERFGMMKFGSRTQVAVPRDLPFEARVAVGDRVRGGSTVIGIIGGGDES